jgi:hypothetical protein
MNTLDESEVRKQLERAVDQLEPVAPPLEMLRARAVRRRRSRRTAGSLMVLAVAGAAAAIVVAVAVLAPSGNDRLQVAAGSVATAPTHASLVRFAKAHGGKHVAGPFTGASASYGVFSTKQAIVVADYDGTQWHQDGPAVTALGKGQFVTRLGLGPQLGAHPSTPSIYVRMIGGDVSYFGSVLRRTGGQWRAAKFGACGHNRLCYPSNSEPYGHVTAGGFVSVSNNCTPNCAAGTDYRVTWAWNPAKQKFDAASEVAIRN